MAPRRSANQPDLAPEPADRPAPSTASSVPSGQQVSLTPPDIVLTRDGGILRGTLVQARAGRDVVIQLVTGNVERIAWSEVQFAGRAEDAPPDRTGLTMHHEERARELEPTVEVQFRSPQRLTLHRIDGTPSSRSVADRAQVYGRECTAPCTLRIEPGVYQFGLSVDVRGPFPAGVIQIDRPGTLRGVHVDNAGLRAAGWPVFLLGVLGGSAALAASLTIDTRGSGHGQQGAVIAVGISAVSLGVLIGVPLMAAGSGFALRFE